MRVEGRGERAAQFATKIDCYSSRLRRHGQPVHRGVEGEHAAHDRGAADERHRALRAAEEHEAEEALALADAISTHCADDTFPRGGFCPLPRGV